MHNELPVRKLNRLKDYDYSKNGAYFVTFCIINQFTVLGKIDNTNINSKFYQNIVLSDLGKIVDSSIKYINSKYNCIEKYVIMPNHVHIIFLLKDSNLSLSDIVKSIKSYTTKKYNDLINRKGEHIWQRSFHDRIIRNEHELYKISNYIDKNIANWELDCFYPM